ncbi:hypothetical protein ACP4OV_018939 [Aristida adscensionis]
MSFNTLPSRQKLNMAIIAGSVALLVVLPAARCLPAPAGMAGGTGAAYTTDEALSRLGFGRFQALLLLFLGAGSVGEAMETMLLSFVGPSVKAEWGVSAAAEGLVSSAVFAGIVVGACAGGLGSDRYGRRAGVQFTALLTAVSGFLCAFSPSYPTLLASRFVVGLGLGADHVLSTWFLEFVPAENRGAWMACFSCFWTLGTILEALLAWKFPGHLLVALLVDRIGRKVSLGATYLLCCAFLAPLAVQLGEGLAITLLFCARACIEGSFVVLLVYSPEIYPTSCRNTGVGVASCIGQFGSIVAPLVTITLVQNCHQKVAVFLMNLLLLFAGVSCAFFPLETKGREIQ